MFGSSGDHRGHIGALRDVLGSCGGWTGEYHALTGPAGDELGVTGIIWEATWAYPKILGRHDAPREREDGQRERQDEAEMEPS